MKFQLLLLLQLIILCNFLIEAINESCDGPDDCESDQICHDDECIPNLLAILNMTRTKKEPPACDTHYHCKYWEKCLDGKCVKDARSLTNLGVLCAIDEDCEPGKVCRGRLCKSAKLFPDLKEIACQMNKDCERGICRDQKCIPYNLLPNNTEMLCKVNEDCGEGKNCTNGKCVPAENVCANDSQCNFDQLCAVDEYCVPDPSFPKYDIRCATIPNDQCYISYPYEECETNEQCADYEVCVMGGFCVPDSNLQQNGTSLHVYKACDKSWIQFRQKCYLPVHGRFTHSEATSYCTKRKAFLVTIRDAEQAAYMNYMYSVGGNGTYWIGLLKDFDGTLEWQNGESVFYTNWDQKQPEPRIGCVIASIEKCTGKWSIIDCIHFKYVDQGFICEKGMRRK